MVTLEELTAAAAEAGLVRTRSRNIGAEFDVINFNYGGKKKANKPRRSLKAEHQGWEGARSRRRLTINKVLVYLLVAFQKPKLPEADGIVAGGAQGKEWTIRPDLMNGRGTSGGVQMKCLSAAYV